MYLRIPTALRILFTLAFWGFAHGLSFIIGFIILQSKARNEVLSLITAFQNPIQFDERLYFYYAFVYLFITILTLVPLGFFLFLGRRILRKIKSTVLYFGAMLIGCILGLLFFWSLLKGITLLPYYLFYASKNSSLWDVLINYFIYSKDLDWQTPSFDMEVFQKEIFISLQSGNMVALVLIFLYSVLRDDAKFRKERLDNLLKLARTESNLHLHLKLDWNILRINTLILHLKIKKIASNLWQVLFIYFFIFAAIIVFVSHTAYQLGGFGKSLTQFDTDFVTVDYNLNGQTKIVEGIRVYQDKNYVVIRDNQNNIHNIFTDQIHIQAKQLQLN
ncbi:hypothetical protein ACFCP7_06670 [Paenibacillus elgii]